mgnify:CR=1 FL=1
MSAKVSQRGIDDFYHGAHWGRRVSFLFFSQRTLWTPWKYIFHHKGKEGFAKGRRGFLASLFLARSLFLSFHTFGQKLKSAFSFLSPGCVPYPGLLIFDHYVVSRSRQCLWRHKHYSFFNRNVRQGSAMGDGWFLPRRTLRAQSIFSLFFSAYSVNSLKIYFSPQRKRRFRNGRKGRIG